ncbi:NADPH-dependent F420 reductase [Leptospira jelokensis]|uniref:NADPH-dependent F420 reductase n=1 Tax=Leptospira jelokensis TaxID=2484931 RepID=A0A4Z0ZY52_9LEPT|nr:NAD(P)-binding domain-containing protein [Leptospira jelokensis]TGL75669.1 NADPH-dependent F420 reductase [Leptospira jelokensis]
MKIAIIGTGNVGGALAKGWSKKGHEILLGVRDPNQFKGKELLQLPSVTAHPIAEATKLADVVVLSTPAKEVIQVTKSLGDTTGKVIIDTMNSIQRSPEQTERSTTEIILNHTNTKDVVKCFNTTGANHLTNPVFGDQVLDLFVAGDSTRGKTIAKHLALDLGFAECYDVGGNDRFSLMEEFALFWINLAMFQKQGRDIGFKLLKRNH